MEMHNERRKVNYQEYMDFDAAGETLKPVIRKTPLIYRRALKNLPISTK